MTEQSTPTPTDALAAPISPDIMTAYDMAMTTGMSVAQVLAIAGWKSPAEVADLVRAGADKAFGEGVAAGMNQADGEWHQRRHVRRAVNPYGKPTSDRADSMADNERNT